MLRILILDDYQNAALDSADWKQLVGTEVDVLHETLPNDAQRASRFEPYDVIVAMRERTPFSASLITALPRLKLLVTTGMTNSAIDINACAAHGVTVCGAPGSKYSAGSTVEVAWALVLGLMKHVLAGHEAMQQGHWQPFVCESLEGKMLGVVGLGKLGTRMARVAQAFGMRVQAWSPHLTAERATATLPNVTSVDKHTLFSTSDVVSLHLMLGSSTEGIVERSDFAVMQRSSYFINTARAALVAPGALLDALRAKELAGAGIDVFDKEPAPIEEPLLHLPNVLASPHVGYVTDDNLRAFYGNAIRVIAAWQNGTPIRVL